MRLHSIFYRLLSIGLLLILHNQACATGKPPNLQDSWEQSKKSSKWVYATNGVHSDYGCDDSNNNCIAPRSDSDPEDPQFPDMWISDWTMFTVMNTKASDKHPPPYTNPPTNLSPDDYLVSYGTTYYDNGYVPQDPEDDEDFGAMLEHYNDFCLPIFGNEFKDNQFTCAFVSLGKKAFFLDYSEVGDTGAPDCCMFSPNNHPPRPDFIKHLDYWPEASKRLNGSVLAYFWRKLWLPTANPRILFAYAFNKAKSPQGIMPKSDWYQHPQSFFFSGLLNMGTAAKPELLAPMISQNYTSFRVEKPPQEMWDNVAKWCPVDTIKKCRLFPDQQKRHTNETQ